MFISKLRPWQNTYFERVGGIKERHVTGGKKWKKRRHQRTGGSWRQMRKKVSLHQTHQLPLLQRVRAQKLDETRRLTLNTGPTALLAQSECVYVCFESLSSVWCLDKNSEINPAFIFCSACFWPLGCIKKFDWLAIKEGKNKFEYIYAGLWDLNYINILYAYFTREQTLQIWTCGTHIPGTDTL